MKSFSKLVESNESSKHWRVQAEIELTLKAQNQGEASYLADSILASTKNQSEYTINSVDEISVMDLKESIDIDFSSIPQDLAPEDKIITAWNDTFTDRQPTQTEKMEFYHQLRKAGFDGIVILNTLKGKI